MKIRQIKAFLAIVSTGGVRPAAKKLCLTPSTVAKSIGQLESDLGAPLFERSALNLRLNAADFMRHALRLAFAQWMAAKPRRFIRARWRPTRSLMFLGINSTFETIFKRNGNKFQLT